MMVKMRVLQRTRKMKNEHKLKIVFIVVVVALTAFISSVFSYNKNWKIYVNKQWGFTISYPNNLSISETSPDNYFFTTDWSAIVGNDYILEKDATVRTTNNVANNGGKRSITTIPLFNKVGANARGDGYYFRTDLTIGASSFPADLKNCLSGNFKIAVDKQGKQKIGRNFFSVFRAVDSGMSQYAEVTSYRILHHDVCFALEIIVAGSSDATREVLQQGEQAKQVAKSIIQTFQFTK